MDISFLRTLLSKDFIEWTVKFTADFKKEKNSWGKKNLCPSECLSGKGLDRSGREQSTFVGKAKLWFLLHNFIGPRHLAELPLAPNGKTLAAWLGAWADPYLIGCTLALFARAFAHTVYSAWNTPPPLL